MILLTKDINQKSKRKIEIAKSSPSKNTSNKNKILVQQYITKTRHIVAVCLKQLVILEPS
jgi:hypothetical protein